MRFFIIPCNTPYIEQIKSVIFGNISTQRLSLNKEFFVCSLREGDTSNYEFLQQYTEHNSESIVSELDNDLWRIKI